MAVIYNLHIIHDDEPAQRLDENQSATWIQIDENGLGKLVKTKVTDKPAIVSEKGSVATRVPGQPFHIVADHRVEKTHMIGAFRSHLCPLREVEDAGRPLDGFVLAGD